MAIPPPLPDTYPCPGCGARIAGEWLDPITPSPMFCRDCGSLPESELMRLWHRHMAQVGQVCAFCDDEDEE